MIKNLREPLIAEKDPCLIDPSDKLMQDIFNKEELSSNKPPLELELEHFLDLPVEK